MYKRKDLSINDYIKNKIETFKNDNFIYKLFSNEMDKIKLNNKFFRLIDEKIIENMTTIINITDKNIKTYEHLTNNIYSSPVYEHLTNVHSKKIYLIMIISIIFIILIVKNN